VTTSAPRSLRRLASRKGVAAALVSAALVASVSACSSVTTTIPYAASDGIRTSVGDVSIVNFLVISNEDGSAGRVLGALTNNSRDASTVSITIPSEGGQPHLFTVEPGETFNLNLDENKTVVGDLGENTNDLADGSQETTPVKPGTVVAAEVSATGTDPVTVQVPVLDGTLPEYADYVPAEDDAS